MRTALILLSVAVTLFCGIILAQSLTTPSVGVMVRGLAIFAFLLVTIGRKVRR